VLIQHPLQPNIASQGRRYVEYFQKRIYTVKPFRKPFEIDDADARSVQKTPAGVLVVRRGLFFVKRQRRYPHICKRYEKDYIENAKAFKRTDNQELQGFLQYVKTGKATTDYTRRIEQMIQTVKHNELARKEYHILPIALMDAFDEGSRQKALETAKTMLTMGYPLGDICKIVGLSQEEVKAIN